MPISKDQLKIAAPHGGTPLLKALHVLVAKWVRTCRNVSLLSGCLRMSAGRQRLLFALYCRVSPVVWRLAVFSRRTLTRHVRVVAVVGSFGKTTTARTTAVALGQRDPGNGSRNCGPAVAARLLWLRPWQRNAVIEVGIDDAGQMERLARRLRPDVAVVTCVGSEHMSSFGTLDVTRAEKAKMVAAVPPSGLVALNADDPNVMWMQSVARCAVVTYGFSAGSDVRATDVQYDGFNGMRYRVHLGGFAHDARTRSLGRHMILAHLAALATAQAEGRDIRSAIGALETLEPTRNRLQPIELPSGAWVVLDAFKGALETTQAALGALLHLPAKRRIVVIGDVEEPPGSQGPIYKALGRRLAEVADVVVFIGGKTNFGRLKAGMIPGGLPRECIHNIRNFPHTIAEFLASELRRGDLALLKGRSTQHMERVALILSGQDVACSAQVCFERHDCETCPLL